MDLARAPRLAPLTARKKGSGYENGMEPIIYKNLWLEPDNCTCCQLAQLIRAVHRNQFGILKFLSVIETHINKMSEIQNF